ncbi:MAG: hypothetical protein KDA80_14445 [Planctomycetaceae bacterium]|nr:hypothetical protein [Planctomycetaceae bacterium]
MTVIISPRDWMVIKLGGSLLDLPDVHDRLDRVIKQEKINAPLIVVGGGGLVDEIRRLDEIHDWPESLSHELALRAMSVTAHLFADSDSRFQLVHSIATANRSLGRRRYPVLDCSGAKWLSTLPCSWDITSDSIAAYVTRKIAASRLLLMKSTELMNGSVSLIQAASCGLVDPFFPAIASELPRIDWCNLRRDSPHSIQWK